MNTPVFLIVGRPQHGKSTVRQIISRLCDLQGGSTSDVIYDALAQQSGMPVEEIRALPKEQVRPKLIALGDWLCGTGKLEDVQALKPEELLRTPSALVRALFLSGVHVIDGVRRRVELQDARNHLEWTGTRTYVIFVDRPSGPQIQDNTEDLKPMADVVIVNDGTVEKLEQDVESWLKREFPQQEAAA